MPGSPALFRISRRVPAFLLLGSRLMAVAPRATTGLGDEAEVFVAEPAGYHPSSLSGCERSFQTVETLLSFGEAAGSLLAEAPAHAVAATGVRPLSLQDDGSSSRDGKL